MSRYDVLLFAHIAFAILWLGSGACLILLAMRADASGDPQRIKQITEDVGWVAHRLIIPSSLAVLALGIWLVVDGPWTFDMLWIDLGLVGFATTFAIGFFFLTPQSKKVAEAIERDGGNLSTQTLEQIRLLFLVSRIDIVTLFAVVAVMALKPTADDTGTLALLAAAIAAVSAYSIARFRAAKAPGRPVGDPAGG